MVKITGHIAYWGPMQIGLCFVTFFISFESQLAGEQRTNAVKTYWAIDQIRCVRAFEPVLQ